MGMRRAVLAICGVVCLSLVTASAAFAQQAEDKEEKDSAARPPIAADEAKPPPAQTVEAKDKKPKVPKRGDFDAGGQVRLPNGPDATGKFKTFNWVAVDVKGRYFLLDSVTANLNIPLAVVKPSMLAPGVEPKLFGGFTVRLDAMLPKMPFNPTKYDTKVGVLLGGGFLREGAALLSEKDYPLFLGDLKPMFDAGLLMKVKLSSAVDFSLVPAFVWQSGRMENLQAVQIPTSLILAIGSLVKVSADLGIYTGDDFSFRAKNGGRIALGGALDVKIGRIIVHGGAGAASLLTSSTGAYPTIGDSFYIDLNVKFAK